MWINFKEPRVFQKLGGKKLIWTTYIRIFTDNGQPKWTLYPRFRSLNYHKRWGMSGFAVYLWGREFNFSFGIDKRGLYVGKR